MDVRSKQLTNPFNKYTNLPKKKKLKNISQMSNETFN